MEITVYEMEHANTDLPESGIACIPFSAAYRQQYMKIYNECFYEMRRSLDIRPYAFLSGFGQIENKIEDIFLLAESGVLIGSVACYGNEIDDLFVNPEFRHRGYGKRLLLWGMNRIKERNDRPVTLHVAQWNEKAVALYKSVGFHVIKVEHV